jgi:hypothetical protein
VVIMVVGVTLAVEDLEELDDEVILLELVEEVALDELEDDDDLAELDEVLDLEVLDAELVALVVVATPGIHCE